MKYIIKIENNQIWFKSKIGVTPEVKNVGYRWSNKQNMWYAPKAYINLISLVEMYRREDIEFDAESLFLLEDTYGFKLDFYKFPKEALQHQVDGGTYLLSSDKAGSLLCLSPGLGKTFTAIVSAKLSGYKNVLIVTPKILMYTWMEEALKWAHIKLNYCYQKEPTSGFCVTNYESLISKIDSYRSNFYDLIIFDESILLKNKSLKTIAEIKEIEASNGKSKKKKVTRYQAALLTRKNANKVWLLSGSPISKFADDLFGQLYLIDSKVFSSYWRFANRYCHIEQNEWGSKIVGTRQDRNVVADLKDYIFVRNKKDVVKLPETFYETIYVEMTKKQTKAYNQMLDDFIVELEGTNEKISVTAAIAQLTKLHQITSGFANLDWEDESAKSDVLLNMINNAEIETPCVIWCHYRKNAEALYERIKAVNDRSALLLGGSKDKDSILTAAKNNEIDYLVLSLESGKHGLTLTNFKTMVYYEKNNNADTYLQSMERIARIGLAHNPLVISLHCRGTIEDIIADGLSNKSLSIASISNYDLAQLLKGLDKYE